MNIVVSKKVRVLGSCRPSGVSGRSLSGLTPRCGVQILTYKEEV